MRLELNDFWDVRKAENSIPSFIIELMKFIIVITR